MKKVFLFSLLLYCCIAGNALSSFGQFEGNWQGVLDANGVALKMLLRISKQTEKYEATLDISSQGAKDLKAETVELTGNTIFIEWTSLGFGIGGSIDKDGNLDALFSQGLFSNTIIFTPAPDTQPVERPQTPKPKFNYEIEEVVFKNTTENLQLAGTLTLPRGIHNPPIAVMISGSGQQDRDETILGHKPFWVIADYFAQHGIGVLRYDDRGVGGSEKGDDFEKVTSANFANDAAAAVAFLRSRGYTHIGIIGHSEGGMIAPMLAAQDAKIGFIILLAGPGVSGGDVLIGQTYAAGDPMEHEQVARFRQGMVKVYVEGTRANASHADITALLDAYMQASAIGASMDLPTREVAVQQVMNALSGDWMEYFIKFDPAVYLEKVQCPLLALNGSKDVQVLSKENLAGIDKALKKGGNKHFTAQEIMGLNHLFQPATTGMVDEYETITTTFDPATLSLMKDWILKLKLK